MKTNYFLKQTLFVVWFFSFSLVFGQTAKSPTFTVVENPIVTNDGTKNFPFMWEVGAAWGDYNNDGYLDLVVSGITPLIIDGAQQNLRKAYFYKNNGNGTFTEVEQDFPAMNIASIVWLDFDNDGNLDLFMAGDDEIGPYSCMFRNLGPEGNYGFEQVFDGEFAFVDNGGGNRGNRYVATADYNNDGWTDILIEGNNSEGRRCRLYKNLLGIGFLEVETPVNGVEDFFHMNAGSSAWGDYNNDGFQDILCNGYFAEDERSPLRVPENLENPRKACGTIVYTNNGDGTFSAPAHFDGGESGESAWCDYNNDGLLDFIVTGYSYEPGIGWQGDLFRNENGSFTKLLPAVTGMTQTQDCSVAWGDVNNDGWEDMLYSRAHPNAIFLNNYGDDTFTKDEMGLTDLDQRGGTVCLVDFDRDNDLDAFMIGYADHSNLDEANSTKGTKLMNNTLGNDIPVNAAPSVPTDLTATVDEQGVVTFNWATATDDLTPSEAINYNLYVQKDGSDVTMFVLPADKATGKLKVNDRLAPISTNSYKMFNLEDGNYTVGVQSIDNAKLTSQFATSTFTIGEGSSVPSVLLGSVYVNVKSNLITIYANSDLTGSIDIYTTNGLKVYSKSGIVNNTVINMNTGVYLIKVSTATDGVIVRKVIVK